MLGVGIISVTLGDSVRVPFGGLKATVPELLFEKKGLIPALQQLIVSSKLASQNPIEVIRCSYNVLIGVGKMLKKLTRHGNSLALVIDKGILELLNIDDQTPLEISTDGTLLLISPVRDEKRKRQFLEAVGKANEKYGRALKRLAD